jgi:ribulose 1,5-bisphosphate synthetase/thiazole synthase
MKGFYVFSVYCLAASLCVASPHVVESAREIPVVYDVDVVVVGGSTRAVAAAVAAKENGASVFLMTERPYLGAGITTAWVKRS